MERSVALQAVAKRLKEENEVLRKENQELQERLAQTQQNKQSLEPTAVVDGDKKRWREHSATPGRSSSPPAKKTRLEPDDAFYSSISFQASHLPSPASMVSTPEASGGVDPQFPGLSTSLRVPWIRRSASSALSLQRGSLVSNHSLPFLPLDVVSVPPTRSASVVT